MDAEAAAKAAGRKGCRRREEGRRGACTSCRCRARARACAENAARREHNSAAKGEASAAAASAKQTKRPPAPAMNSGLSSLARQIEKSESCCRASSQEGRARRARRETRCRGRQEEGCCRGLGEPRCEKPAAKPAVERRPKPAPTAAPRKSSFDSLLSQIEAEKNRLTAEKAARPSRNVNAAAGNKKNPRGAW